MPRNPPMSSTREDGRPAFLFYVQDWLCEATLKVVSMGSKGLWIDVLCLMARSPIKGYLLTPTGTNANLEWVAAQLGRPVEEIRPFWQELLDAGTPRIDEKGRIYSKRMVEDKTLSEKRSEAGRFGGRPKSKGKAKGKQTGNGETLPDNDNDNDNDNDVVEFDLFWKLYPKKTAKKKAIEAWEKAEDKPAIEIILAAVKAQSASEQWQKDGGQFIPHPATWLNQGRWADEIGPASGKEAEREAHKKQETAWEKRAAAFARIGVGDKAVGPEGQGIVTSLSNTRVSVKVAGYGFVNIEDLETLGKWTFVKEGDGT